MNNKIMLFGISEDTTIVNLVMRNYKWSPFIKEEAHYLIVLSQTEGEDRLIVEFDKKTGKSLGPTIDQLLKDSGVLLLEGTKKIEKYLCEDLDFKNLAANDCVKSIHLFIGNVVLDDIYKTISDIVIIPSQLPLFQNAEYSIEELDDEPQKDEARRNVWIEFDEQYKSLDICKPLSFNYYILNTPIDTRIDLFFALRLLFKERLFEETNYEDNEYRLINRLFITGRKGDEYAETTRVERWKDALKNMDRSIEDINQPNSDALLDLSLLTFLENQKISIRTINTDKMRKSLNNILGDWLVAPTDHDIIHEIKKTVFEDINKKLYNIAREEPKAKKWYHKVGKRIARILKGIFHLSIFVFSLFVLSVGIYFLVSVFVLGYDTVNNPFAQIFNH